MKWLMRFLLWATLLAVPSWFIGPAYHRMLAWVTLATLGIAAPVGAIPPPDIPASHVLGVFAAMCLASAGAPWQRRLRAVAIGIGVLVVIEWLTGTVAVAWAMRDSGVSPFVLRLEDNLSALPAWIGAPVLWLALLGDAELPGLRRMRQSGARSELRSRQTKH